eukprot:350609_1
MALITTVTMISTLLCIYHLFTSFTCITLLILLLHILLSDQLKYIQNIIVYLFMLWNIYSLVSGPNIAAFHCTAPRGRKILYQAHVITNSYIFPEFSLLLLPYSYYILFKMIEWYLLSLVVKIFASYNMVEFEEYLFL